MTNSKPEAISAGAILGLVLSALSIAAVLCGTATYMERRFDAQEARTERVESKLDAIMSAFDVKYVPKVDSARNGDGREK
jgi:hypothetical protein